MIVPSMNLWNSIRLCIVIALFAGSAYGSVSYDLGCAILTLTDQGQIDSFRSKSGVQYAAPANAPAMVLSTAEGDLSPINVRASATDLTVDFGRAQAQFIVEPRNGVLMFTLQRLTSAVDVKRFVMLRLEMRNPVAMATTMNGFVYHEAIIALMAADIHVHAMRNDQGISVEVTSDHGLQPAKFGLIMASPQEMGRRITDFEILAGLPDPRTGGLPLKQSPLVKHSYIFLDHFGLADLETALRWAREGEFDTILIGQRSWCATTGHFGINTELFPGGLGDLKKMIQRFHDAGFLVGLHFLSSVVSISDSYVTPTPDPRLAQDVSAILTDNIDQQVTFIPVDSAPALFPEADLGYTGRGTVLRVDNELIWYERKSTGPPGGFYGCKRGYLGTTPSAHRIGARVSHIMKSFDNFLFDIDSTMLDEVASNLATVVNSTNVDMVYLDGAENLQGDHWYYNGKLIAAYYEKLRNSNMLVQASSESNYSWHIVSRQASADGHDDLKAYLEERSTQFDVLKQNLLPLDIGWYNVYDLTTTPDAYEYILGATIAYDSSMSLLLAPDTQHPFLSTILELIARYERLRLSGRVPQELRERMRIDAALARKMSNVERSTKTGLRHEYRLLSSGGTDVFQRVAYGQWHNVDSVTNKGSEWEEDFTGDPVRVGVQFRVTSRASSRPGAAYLSRNALNIESFKDLRPYYQGTGAVRAASAGVTQDLVPAIEDCSAAQSCGVFSAASSNIAGGWSMIGKQFPEPLDFSSYQGLGLWFKGDGHGGQFRMQLRDGIKVADFYVSNDSDRWLYYEFLLPANKLNYRAVRSVWLYYNSLPVQTRVSCRIGSIKAITTVDPFYVSNPRLQIDGSTPVVFRWRINAGETVTAWPGEPVHRAAVGADMIQLADRSPDIQLPPGIHRINIGFDPDSNVAVQVRTLRYLPERYVIP